MSIVTRSACLKGGVLQCAERMAAKFPTWKFEQVCDWIQEIKNKSMKTDA
jgi:hypothetical protein